MFVGWQKKWQSGSCSSHKVKGRAIHASEGEKGRELSRQGAEARAIWVVGALAKSQLGREVLGPFGPWQLG